MATVFLTPMSYLSKNHAGWRGLDSNGCADSEGVMIPNTVSNNADIVAPASLAGGLTRTVAR